MQMRHANSNITMNIYAVSSKSGVKVVEMILPTEKATPVESLNVYFLVYCADFKS